MSGGTFGANGKNVNYVINFEYETRDTELTFRIFNTHNKKDIIENLRKAIDDLDKYWTQTIDGKET